MAEKKQQDQPQEPQELRGASARAPGAEDEKLAWAKVVNAPLTIGGVRYREGATVQVPQSRLDYFSSKENYDPPRLEKAKAPEG